ncbi:15139_t:CDS:2, partial [Acaulospora colombiana]
SVSTMGHGSLFNIVMVSPAEKGELETQLRLYVPPSAVKDFPSELYFKVPWTRVPDLVEKRRVYLRAGIAYVAKREQSSIIFQQFQAELERALELTARALPRMDEDRLTPILNHLSKGFLAGISSEYSSAPASGEADHHLKHQARLQY